MVDLSDEAPVRIMQKTIGQFKLDQSQLRSAKVSIRFNNVTFYNNFGLEKKSSFFDIEEVTVADSPVVSSSGVLFMQTLTISETMLIHTDLSQLFSLKYDIIL